MLLRIYVKKSGKLTNQIARMITVALESDNEDGAICACTWLAIVTVVSICHSQLINSKPVSLTVMTDEEIAEEEREL
jgi:hypothetical protein